MPDEGQSRTEIQTRPTKQSLRTALIQAAIVWERSEATYNRTAADALRAAIRTYIEYVISAAD